MYASRILFGIGRALVGALAGLIVVGLTMLIATDYLRLFSFENSVAGDRSFRAVMYMGGGASALFAAVFGRTQIKGRAETTLKGMSLGAVIGILVGAALGSVAGMGKIQAGGVILGIFLGGPFGALIGGFFGADAASFPVREKQVPPTEGVRDPELDGPR